MAIGVGAATTVGPDAAMTERVDIAATTGSPTVTLETSDQALAAAGSTGTRTLTTPVAAASAVVTVALNPITTGGTPGGATTYQYEYATSGGCGANPNAGANTNRTKLTINSVVQATYCYDGADRLTSTTATGYNSAISYDSRGNTTTLAGETLGYDSSRRHITTTKGTTTVTYVRDVTNRIVQRTSVVNGGTASIQRYSYSGGTDSSSFTLNSTGALIERTVVLPGGVLLTKRAGGDVWSYPNIHGDLTATTNASGVKQGATVIYDPYGQNTNGPIPDNSDGTLDYGWVGQHQRPLEQTTGLQPTIEMGARPYHPTLGRFLQLDPIPGGATDSDYAYVNDPINTYDLNGEGLFGIECGWCGKAWDATGGKAATRAKKHWRGLAQGAAFAGGVIGGALCAASVVCGILVGAAAAAGAYAATNAGTSEWSTGGLVSYIAIGGLTGGLGASASKAWARAGSIANGAVGFLGTIRAMPRVVYNVAKSVIYHAVSWGVQAWCMARGYIGSKSVAC